MNTSEPIKLIIDTDLGSDSDDVGALMVAHRLHQAGECELLAVTSSVSRSDSVAAIDVINRFYGADLPTGNVKINGYAKRTCTGSIRARWHSRTVAVICGNNQRMRFE